MYRLRELERRDITEINKWRNDQNLSKKLGGGYRYVCSEIENAWYDRYLSARNNSVRCAIVDENDVIVGVVYLLNIDDINRCADLHIMIGNEDNRGKGVGFFAVSSIINHAFYNLNLKRLQLEVLEYNEHAQALYKKAGFVLEGRKRKAVFKDGQYVDELIMGLLRDEYQRVNSSG